MILDCVCVLIVLSFEKETDEQRREEERERIFFYSAEYFFKII